MSEFRFIPKNKIKNLPKNPGVYCFKKDREILYIGKATNIRERVKNHFQQPGYRDYLFLDKVRKIGYIKTDSEFAEPSAHLTSHPASQGSTIEALILEANLIKKYQPKYNVIWRDDKNYFFVGITKGDFPQVFITHQPRKIQNPKGARQGGRVAGGLESKIQNIFIGPFVDGKSLKKTLDVLRKIFPYRTCKKLPRHPCLWHHLNRCPAPCLSKIQNYRSRTSIILRDRLRKECQGNARNLMKILQGKKNQVIINLRKEMEGASKLQDFEKAAKIRDQITALKKILAHATIFEPAEVKLLQNQNFWPYKRIEAYDISNIQGEAAAGSMVTFIDGKPEKSQYRRFKIRGKFTPYRNEVSGAGPNDIAMLKECLTRRLRHPEWPYPDLILIDGGRGQLNAAQSVVKYEIQNTKYKIQTMALAKKENKLYIEGQKEPLLLKELPREIFNLILQLRDEAHRFAISYHRKLRKRGLLEN